MFTKPFSFEGRIRRTEYGISMIIYAVIAVIINLMIESSNGDAAILGIAYIPLLWFLWAQGAKRCHDVGNSGWWQLIPFYGFWLLFQDGNPGINQYGDNPKGSIANSPGYGNTPPGTNNSSQNNSGTSYQGGYNGGHNNPNQSFNASQNASKTFGSSSGYKDGDLYN